MKKIFILILLVCVSSSAKLKDEVFVISNVEIIDGDTISADVEMTNDIVVKAKIRFLGIDAPEIHGQCEEEIQMANKAKNRLAELMSEHSEFYIKKVKDDKYNGRIDAYVYKTKDSSLSINQMLIEEGLVRPYLGKKRLSWCDGV